MQRGFQKNEKLRSISLTRCMMGGIVYLALRRYLSWIEGLTTNQNVTGSNPVRRTSRLEDPDCSGGPGFSFLPLRGRRWHGGRGLRNRTDSTAFKKMQIVLDSTKGEWQYIPRVAALPQLDRGSDYESERHRFESCTPHQPNLNPGRLIGPGFFRSFVADGRAVIV